MILYLKYCLFILKKIFVSANAPGIISVYFLFFIHSSIHAQQYDILIKNGHVIDPKNHIDAKKDVAVANGKIAKVADDIASSESKKTIDATGLYVVPGLIDIHTHV